MLLRAARYYAAGSLGGLAVVLTAWAFGRAGVAGVLGVDLEPPLELGWLYRAVVWGGLWGLVFLLPVTIRPLWLKGLIFTLAPVAAALVYFIPLRGGAMFGLDKGMLAPVYIYVVNIPWGLVTAYFGRRLGAAERT